MFGLKKYKVEWLLCIGLAVSLPTYAKDDVNQKLELLGNHLTSKEIFEVCRLSYQIRDEQPRTRTAKELEVAKANAVLCHVVMDTVRSGFVEASSLLNTTSGRNNSVDKACYEKQVSSYNKSPLWFLKESVDATPSGYVIAEEHIGKTVYLVVSNYIHRTCRVK